ncbi:MAG: HdaA/DnaA family protein [Stellaceae bacterium]
MTQLPLGLPHRASVGRGDFLTSPANRAALAWIERWPDWPVRGLVLHGPPGSGKTHLAHLWCARAGAALVGGAELVPEAVAPVLGAAPGAIAVDDAEQAPEAALLHLYNACSERGGSILVVARQPAAAWRIALPDLASRLRALPAVGIEPPDDALLASVLVKLFTDRQVTVKPPVIGYLTRRMERSFAAATALAAALDHAQMSEGGAITIPLARRILAAMDQSENDLTVT